MIASARRMLDGMTDAAREGWASQPQKKSKASQLHQPLPASRSNARSVITSHYRLTNVITLHKQSRLIPSDRDGG
ncbi:hypothetical protein AGR9A_Lc20172 [Agrobacterium salinitolerans str. Hayward 0363]|nr:hypothetical protein AGR9A_Lc20172 [Agrobacterium salinitolerans str. Hayward 0363]